MPMAECQCYLMAKFKCAFLSHLAPIFQPLLPLLLPIDVHSILLCLISENFRCLHKCKIRFAWLKIVYDIQRDLCLVSNSNFNTNERTKRKLPQNYSITFPFRGRHKMKCPLKWKKWMEVFTSNAFHRSSQHYNRKNNIIS